MGKAALDGSNAERSAKAMDAILSYFVFHFNQHMWHHCKSCFKRSATTQSLGLRGSPVCRYLFPRLPVDATSIDEHGRVQQQRGIGCEYVNSWNSLVMRSLLMNHNVRSLMTVKMDVDPATGMVKDLSLSRGVADGTSSSMPPRTSNRWRTSE